MLARMICLSLLVSALLIRSGLAGQHADILIPRLIEALHDADANVRQRAAQALGKMGPEAHAAVPALIEALSDADDNVQWNAAQALGRIGTKAIPALIGALQDASADLRWRAAQALGRMGPEAHAAVPALIEALNDADADVREGAAQGLGRIGTKAVPALIDALKDADATVRWSAAQALEGIGPEAHAAVPALIDALNDADADVRGRASRAIAAIARALQDSKATERIGSLKAALAALTTHPDADVREQAAVVRGAIDFLELFRWSHLPATFLHMVYDYLHLGVLVAAYLALLLCWLTFHWCRPLWLYRLNEALQPYTDVALPAWLGGMKLPLRHILLVGLFQYSRRMLDAWVSQHLPTAREEFLRIATVRDRAIHIPVPVILDGHVMPTLGAEHLRPTFDKPRACLLIWGEGGAGKTSLACQVAQWAMADTQTERLCTEHRMLPVLLEQGIEVKSGDGLRAFTEAIRGELRALISAPDPIPEELLQHLLRQRRVLVIVDHLWEMPEATRQVFHPGHLEFPVNALVVTSRLDERLDGVPRTTIKPLRIQGNRLSSFMEAYLTQREKRELFDDAEYFDACRRLSLMVGERDITILLAKLYAEQMIAAKEGVVDGALPENIPDLMLSYVNEVNRGIEDHKQDDRLVHRVAKTIAWECLKRTYRPIPAQRHDVLSALAGEHDAEAVLTYLEERLRLIQTIGAGRNQIRFALDPLAEYLAGLYIVQAHGDNEDAWVQFFTRADTMPGGPEAIKEFLLAVRDCCLAQQANAKGPDTIAVELAKRTSGNAASSKQASLDPREHVYDWASPEDAA